MLENINLRFLLIYTITTIGIIRYLLQISPVVWTDNRDYLFWFASAGEGLMVLAIIDDLFFELIPKPIQLSLILLGGAIFIISYLLIKKKYYSIQVDENDLSSLD